MPASDQGISQDRFKLIPRTLIFIIRGESVLLLKGAKNKRIWANRYNGVGGHIELGEDVMSAGYRELKEETGLVVDELWLAGTVMIDAGESTGIGLYILKGSSQEGDTLSSSEGQLEWIPFDSIQSLDLVDDLPVLLPKVIQQKVQDPPFSAKYYYDANDSLVVEFFD